ncbi:MAG TPA: DUF3179 domain-containing protein [Gemmatimonadales bacterium]
MSRSVVPTLVLALVPFAARAQDADGWRTDFSRHSVPLAEIVSGGPPKDGIPAVDRPRFVTVRQADRWLVNREPVVAVSIGGETKAYPLQILIWHEIVNDAVGGVPVVVTFCPLCNTALAFDRRHRERLLDFGTTGRLRHSDLVMYDRQTESWWQQATGEGIVGAFAGDRLSFVPAPVVSWETFKGAYPDGQVLSRDTGHDRPYGRNPYRGYDAEGAGPIPGFARRSADDRLPAMERVAAVRLGDETVAYPFTLLSDRRVVNDAVAGRPIVVLWRAGTASALDRAEIAQGRDVGSTGVFDRRIDGTSLTFAADAGGRFRDRETRTTWDILGRAVSGPLAGRQLDPIQHGNHFWFAWGVFQPNTRVAR